VKVVHGGKAAEANWVVVVSVDAEDRKADIHVGVGVVHHAVVSIAV